MKHDLTRLANALYGEKIIHEGTKTKVCNEVLDINTRGTALLDAVEDKIRLVPSDFERVNEILLSVDDYYKGIVQELRQTYSE